MKTLVITLIVLVALLFAVAWVPLVQARNEWRAGHNAEAIAIADRWSVLHLWRGDYEQVLAAAFLSAGNDAAARPHLANIDHVLVPVIDKSDVARRLFARDRYADFLAYDAASQERNDSDDVRLYRAAALTATNQIDAASRTLQSIHASNVDKSKYGALRAAIDQRKTDAVPYVFDRTNRAIAIYRPRTNDVVSIDPDFAPLIDRDAGALTIGAHASDIGVNDTLDTTLDTFVQKAALTALGKNRGSLVAIDPQTNEILAIANSGPKENRAFEKEYEP
ncbi:MAG TPA: tetratricopeptide repeat protein, partial [Thermoanaerobaculia bacterium]|nr:tetratricopeptide repeat protein [Thermoanaerobaculia bacterium]